MNEAKSIVINAFAGLAMQGIIGSYGWSTKKIAECAYDAAEEMFAEGLRRGHLSKELFETVSPPES